MRSRLDVRQLLERKDYHAVPQVLGRRKNSAGYFAKMWKKYLGKTKLIYTRTTEGRHHLLKARGHSLSRAMQRRSERTSCWK